MDIKELYMNLPCDLSGSMSKNRFRNEILWGLEKIYDVYKTKEDFVVVFDYVCDIEVHLNSRLEFYQVKTHKSSNAFSLKKALKKNKAGHSVLGKLYLLKTFTREGKNILKLAIVSNTFLRGVDSKLYSEFEVLCFTQLREKCKEAVREALKQELALDHEADLDNLFFVRTSMDLFNPQESLLGKTVKFFYDVKGEEPKKPMTLFNVLSETITNCATYELKCNSYQELIKNKGITKNTIDNILRQYTEEISVAIQECINEIHSEFKLISDRYRWKNALTTIVHRLSEDLELQELENEIVEYLKEQINEFQVRIFDLVDILQSNFKNKFPVGYEINEQKALILLIIKKFEEGVY